MSNRTQAVDASPGLRWAVIAAIAAIAFFASYRFAVAQTTAPQTAIGAVAVASDPAGVAAGTGAAPGATSGGGCCGSGAAGPATTKQADVKGGVQTIAVDLSTGAYNPNTIELKAGVPAEITFGQSGGCTAQVQSQELGFFEDLTSGPKTIKLGALQAGTYQFTCGMGMASGSIVVK